MWLVVLLACAQSDPTPFVVVSFNSGTTEGMAHDDAPDDGYTSEHATTSDRWYGDGLAWDRAITETTDFFAELDPDVVVFQEIFHSDLCTDIPADQHLDFVCQDWQPGDLTVAQTVLGDGWQVMCQLGKDDKCAAVKRSFGQFRGCDSDFCLEGLDGAVNEGCGGGSRLGRGVVELAVGGEFTLVNVHGNSGLTGDDEACRAAQVEQVFVDMDGEPAANGERNIVLGDLNTDPGRWADFDASAARWMDFVGGDSAFGWVTEIGPDAPPTYASVANIDHVASDTWTGDCEHPQFLDAVYFDHRPAVCTLY